jgi:glycine/D-amino acid oxidase-like deaminating enzyme
MSFINSRNIAVLGGGVTGLTVAAAFQATGSRVTLYSENNPFAPGTVADPLVPTFYAGAILYPDQLPLPRAKEVVAASTRVFARLSSNFPESSVYKVKHCVIGEGLLPEPEFPDLVEPIDSLSSAFIPGYRPSHALDGYCYPTQLAELPSYIPWLRSLFLSLGGTIEQCTLRAEDIPILESDLTINCLGYGGEKIFPELDGVGELVRGSLCYIKEQPLLLNLKGERITFQYRPSQDVYWSDTGNEMFVYAYPRSDGMLLGGVREPGRLVNGVFVPRWEFDKKLGAGLLTVPEPVLTENERILKDLFHIDINRPSIEILVGFRYSINESNGGVRLGIERSHSKPTMHCVGWGPSGVTYSWGCALKLLAEAVREGILTSPDWSAVFPLVRSLLEEEFSDCFSL